jgi:hypothetical protein
MVMRYLGSTANVVASSLGLVTLVLCVVFDAGWATFPIVIGVYAVSAVVAWFLLPQRPDEEAPTVRPRRAAL